VKRAIVLALSIILALTMAAPNVLAQGNGGKPEDVSGIIPPEDVAKIFPGHCSFPIQLELSGKGKTIVLPDGRRILTSPGLHVTVTNVETGEQATFNVTGTSHETTNLENGNVTTRITGRNLPFDPVEGVNLTIGNFSFVFDKDGNLIKSFADPPVGNGQVIDVCELLS
jgi:hypothetical protein